MSLVLKLSRAGNELDLTALPFRPDESFVPPVTAVQSLMAGGTADNQYGGSRKVYERTADISWNLPLQIRGDGAPQINAEARRLAAWLAQAGGTDPLMLEHRSSAPIEREPLWGQYGANNRYEIVSAETPFPDGTYGTGTMRARHVLHDCQMTLAPFWRRRRQRLASATGGVLEDTIGVADGRPRGLIVPASTTNKMTNPVFGHGTWNNGWTADASLVAAQEMRDGYVLFGLSSASLRARSTGQEFYQSINVGNTNDHTLSCYVRRPDGREPTSSDMQLFYGSAQTTIFREVGNGWWRAIAYVTGVASATNTGLQVKNGRTVYVDGFQLEEKSFASPLAYGEMLGCAWTGTAHASTSTRTAARVRIAVGDALDYAEGMIRIVWVPDRDSSEFIGDGVLFSDGTLTLHWDQANNRFEFTDGTNTAVSGALGFSAGDVFALHAVWSPTVGLELYAQGVRIAVASTYTPPAAGTYLYIGTSSTPGLWGYGTLKSFETYDYAPTPDEIAADVADLAGLASTDMRVGAIPWLWTQGGDDQVDNADDSTYDNWCVCGGVEGDAPAVTEMILTVEDWDGGSGRLWVSNFTSPVFVPTSNMYGDASGTVDANSSGGEYDAQTITSAGFAAAFRLLVTESAYYKYVRGREFYVVFRAQDAGSNLQIKTAVLLGDLLYDTAIRNITIGSGSFALYISDPIVIADAGFIADAQAIDMESGVYFIRSTGSADLSIDFLQMMVRPLMYLYVEAGASDAYYHSEYGQYNYARSTATIGSPINLRGDRVRLVPNMLNTLHFANATNPAIDSTVDLAGVYATPRGRLL